MSTVTVDGSNGPGKTLSATVFSNINSITFDTAKQQLVLYNSAHTTYIDISTAVTITVTVVDADNYTIVVADS